MQNRRNQLLVRSCETERTKRIIASKELVTRVAGYDNFDFFARQPRYQSGRQDRAVTHHFVQLFGSSRTQFQTTFDRKHLFSMTGADRSSRHSGVFTFIKALFGKANAE